MKGNAKIRQANLKYREGWDRIFKKEVDNQPKELIITRNGTPGKKTNAPKK